MKYLRCGIGVLLLLIGVSAAHCQSSDTTSPLLKEFTAHLQSPDALKEKPFESRLQERLVPFAKMRRGSFANLERYYQHLLELFSKEYPDGSFNIHLYGALYSFSDTKKFEVPEVHAVPFMPISLLSYDDGDLKFEKLQTEYGNKTIHGLRIITSVSNRYLKLPGPRLNELYMPDINARMLGFNHGQLILDLSDNVQAGDKFEYNGFRKWSEHQRYRRFDQVESPIPLTNFAHETGKRYAVSAHPDFSVQCPNFREQTVKMTFFLWKTVYTDQAKNMLPDFIYQIYLHPKSNQ